MGLLCWEWGWEPGAALATLTCGTLLTMAGRAPRRAAPHALRRCRAAHLPGWARHPPARAGPRARRAGGARRAAAAHGAQPRPHGGAPHDARRGAPAARKPRPAWQLRPGRGTGATVATTHVDCPAYYRLTAGILPPIHDLTKSLGPYSPPVPRGPVRFVAPTPRAARAHGAAPPLATSFLQKNCKRIVD